jgi:protein PhnA
MSTEKVLQDRSQQQCELCKATQGLSSYEIPPHSTGRAEDSLYICEKCKKQLDKKEDLDAAHWNCLNESMWSEVPAVQVVSWRLLNRLRNESWAAEAIDMMYFDEETMAWAKASGDHENSSEVDLHRDCNGAILEDGDTVVLTKSLDVKGSTLNARLGTVVKHIRLVKDNTEQIEGKIEGQTIVILTKYLRKG